jgi:hypothetical protein
VRAAEDGSIEIRIPGDPPSAGREVEVVVMDPSGRDRIRTGAKGVLEGPEGKPTRAGRLVGFGRLSFEDVAPGTYTLRVRTADVEPLASEFVVPVGTEPLRREVRLREGSTLTGRLVVDDAKPEHLSLLLVPDADPNPGADWSEEIPERVEYGRPSPDGTYVFRGLAPGRYRTVESRSGHGHAVASPALVEIPERGEARVDLRFVRGFRLSAQVDAVPGRLEVVDASGAVRHREASDGYPAGLRQPSGIRLPPGSYVVRLTFSDGRAPLEKPVVLDQDRAIRISAR